MVTSKHHPDKRKIMKSKINKIVQGVCVIAIIITIIVIGAMISYKENSAITKHYSKPCECVHNTD